MQLIYDQLIPGNPVWDFCCDHGYMGLNAYESGEFPSIHFVDQVRHIIEQLERRFEQEHYIKDHSAQAFFLPLAGEDLLTPVEGNVVIAGVGAFTIERILRSISSRGLLRAKKLILCPQGRAEKLLQSLPEIPDFDYEIGNEDCQIDERGRIRKLLIFNKK
ncbi:SAM-dependent methyltransferase [Bdellovibrio bacteriovorus]|uniref:SAM-dependent methyltransferase n=1 Tax=Bdellovibrio bacteriovorus TaxID=959 RepID=A0A150WT93_BDEBC|nr:SAM-dependent methyltransferase [Bdellovibrio bacteriovorus]KYG67544.1 SAM-dependent methyltransferase [Bdellovibrio bacteriovorus]